MALYNVIAEGLEQSLMLMYANKLDTVQLAQNWATGCIGFGSIGLVEVEALFTKGNYTQDNNFKGFHKLLSIRCS